MTAPKVRAFTVAWASAGAASDAVLRRSVARPSPMRMAKGTPVHHHGSSHQVDVDRAERECREHDRGRLSEAPPEADEQGAAEHQLLAQGRGERHSGDG